MRGKPKTQEGSRRAGEPGQGGARKHDNMYRVGDNIIANVIISRILRTQTRLRICLYSSIRARLLRTTWIHVVETLCIFPILRTGIFL